MNNNSSSGELNNSQIEKEIEEQKKRDEEIAKLLEFIEKTDNINSIFEDDVTPIYRACARGYIDVVKLLLENPDLDVNQGSEYREREDFFTPLHAACAYGHVDIVKLLVRHPYIEPNNGYGNEETPLYIACRNGNTDVVQILLEHPDTDINCGYYHYRGYHFSPLSTACARNYIDIVKVLLNNPYIDINEGHYTPLYEACSEGYIDIVKLLLEHPDIDVNQISDELEDLTPLYIACYGGYVDIVELLVTDYGDKIKTPAEDIKRSFWKPKIPEQYKIVSIICYGLNMKEEDILKETEIEEYNIWKKNQTTKSARK